MRFSVRYMSLSLVYSRLTLVSLPRALHLLGPPGSDAPLLTHTWPMLACSTQAETAAHTPVSSSTREDALYQVWQEMESQLLGFIAYKMLSQKLKCGSPPQTSRALHLTNTFLTFHKEFSRRQDHSAEHTPE